MNPLTALPTNVRKWVYVLYATLGIAFGAAQVGFATAAVDQPTWLLVAFGVFAYLGTALGLVAAANTQPVSKAALEQIQKYSDVRERLAADIAASRATTRQIREQQAAVKHRLDAMKPPSGNDGEHLG